MDKLVYIEKNEPVTTSLVIAEKTGNGHRGVMQLIRTHQKNIASFGVLTFQMTKPRGKNGGRPITFVALNEQQTTFLMSLMNNSEIVVEFKKELVKQFYTMRKTLDMIAINQSNEEWKRTRELGKNIRQIETDAIKEFVEYAKAQGSKNAERYYANISKMENKALFFMEEVFPNIRQVASGRQIGFLITADQIIQKTIKEAMQKGLHYKEIYQIAKENIETCADLIGKTPIPDIEFKMLDSKKLEKEMEGK